MKISRYLFQINLTNNAVRKGFTRNRKQEIYLSGKYTNNLAYLLNISTQDLKNTIWSMLGILLGLWISGCAAPSSNISPESENKLLVVSTSTIIADMTEKIGGDEIEHQGIIKPGADPHIYEPVPTDSVAFEKADLIIYNGYNLEPTLIKLMNAAGIKAQKLAVGEKVKPLQNLGKGELVPDPHVWGDAENGIVMVKGIRDALIELSPEDKEVFMENAAKLVEELGQVDIWIMEQIGTIPEGQRRLVTTHDAFEYYAKAYGLEMTGTLIGMSTEEQPSAQTVKNLVKEIKKSGVPAIFAETTINPKLITTVAQEAGVRLAPRELYSDSIGAPGSEGDSYTKMLVSNTQAIVEALGGEYTAFELQITGTLEKN
ncbi:periplasmic solute binding protein [Trichodesmium erythraeum IMS101]|uniref:Periplasmic solute binding protein n=1 Tax=Trichodesmium erythraeum (strain IMS101) TaxID=203124 RepID=Q10ZI8_TRIEI|nr:zinc ABC transporter substrate-binding protein [Trichodesmium erythraeum GBRTRLIN201]